MPTPVIRIAGTVDGPAVAALRRAWTAEDQGDVADPDYEARFLDWYERESARRISWLGELSGEPVGMMNLAIFERMPRPGRETGTWGYLANAFVLEPQRNQGIGARLLTALLAYADDQGYIRIVLRPSERAIPFYRRAGFAADGGFLVRYPPRSLLDSPGDGHLVRRSAFSILVTVRSFAGVIAHSSIQRSDGDDRSSVADNVPSCPIVFLRF